MGNSPSSLVESLPFEAEKLSKMNSRESVKAGLNELVDRLVNHIEGLYEKDGTTCLFVVGGKSLSISGAVLDVVAARLPEGHPARKDIAHRVRLSPTESEDLYAKRRLNHSYVVPKKLKEKVEKESGNWKLVLVDDFMEEGRKMYRLLDAVTKEWPEVDVSSIVMAGRRVVNIPDHLDYRGPNWENYVDRVYIPSEVGEREADLKMYEFFKTAADLQSNYIDLLTKREDGWSQPDRNKIRGALLGYREVIKSLR